MLRDAADHRLRGAIVSLDDDDDDDDATGAVLQCGRPVIRQAGDGNPGTG